MTKTSELTTGELIATLADQYYTALRSMIHADDDAIDSQAFSLALMRLESEGRSIDVVPYLTQASSDYFEHCVEPMMIAGCHGRVEIQAWKLISRACDLFRVLNPHRL